MQKFPIWFGGAQIFFSKASVLFHPRVLFFRRYQNFPVTCFAVQFIFFRPHQNFPFTWCSGAVFSDSTKIFHSRGVLQFFFSDGTKIFHSRVLQFLFFRQHKFSSHVFCSCFFRQHQNFPFTWCYAVLFSDSTKIFHSRVLQFLFFRQLKFSIHVVFCSSFFSDSTNFPGHVFCSYFFPTAKIFQPRVASLKLANISTTCDVVFRVISPMLGIIFQICLPIFVK